MEIDFPASGMESQLEALWQLAFRDEESFIRLFFTRVYSPERCRCVLVDGQAAAVLYWFDGEYRNQQFAYLYAVATHPDFRRRGLCRALVEDTHVLLTRQGYDGTLLLPAEEGLRCMYRQMGYRDCCTVSQFTCRAETPIPIWSVDQEEYARLRRKLLPEDGVLQEGKNLDFLVLQADTYAGEGFVLAASPEGEHLNVMELLGDREAAPGILASLGYASGTFRTPGSEIPFAMFHPLREHTQPPVYFGLSFD